MSKTKQKMCPCNSDKNYAQCCAPIHQGEPAQTPEALMRSRYSAYVLGLEDYLLATWHPSTRPERLDIHTSPQPKWIGLQILACSQQDATHGRVRFVARYRINGRAQRLEEDSRFILEDGHWFYLDGDITD